VICNDGDPCTDDLCSPLTGLCFYPPTNCDDGDPCTDDDCDPLLGGCVHTPRVPLNDGDPCTDDICDPQTGLTTHIPKDCSDGDPCTDDDCDPATGDCVHTPRVPHNDEDPCTDDICDPQTGLTTHTPKDCSDGDPCTDDSCDPATGDCVHTPIDCDDGDPCTIDSCDPFTGACVHTPVDCDDNNLCTIDSCDPATGLCVNTPIDCNDDDPCTEDTCDPLTGICLHTSMTDLVITAELINQDDPTNSTWTMLAEGAAIYGGSEPSTADNLRLTITPSPGTIINITWDVAGVGSGSFSTPPAGSMATQWNLGDIIAPIAGDIEFAVQVTHSDGTVECGSFMAEIGVRTDDVIVVGWIDPNGVSLPAGAAGWLTAMMPPTGPPVPSSLDCNLFMLDLSENSTTPLSQTITAIDRDYILKWLFKFAGNTDPTLVIPGGDFRDPNGSYLDEAEVTGFAATPTNYKLFSRLQVAYVLNGTSLSQPTILQSRTETGETVNPCGAIVGFLGSFPGQVGPADFQFLLVGNNQRIVTINDGSPDTGAIRAFNTLTAKDLPPGQAPVFWENIGSKITFTANSGTSPTIVMQPYPTYYVYRNGTLVNIVPQAATPNANFNGLAYPFGTVSCIGVWGVTPGGRCGDAASPPAPSARIPPSQYVVP